MYCWNGHGRGRRKNTQRQGANKVPVRTPRTTPLLTTLHPFVQYNCLDLSWQDESPGFREISVVSIRHSTLRQLDLRGLAACSFIILVALLSRISSPAFFFFLDPPPFFCHPPCVTDKTCHFYKLHVPLTGFQQAGFFFLLWVTPYLLLASSASRIDRSGETGLCAYLVRKIDDIGICCLSCRSPVRQAPPPQPRQD